MAVHPRRTGRGHTHAAMFVLCMRTRRASGRCETQRSGSKVVLCVRMPRRCTSRPAEQGSIRDADPLISPSRPRLCFHSASLCSPPSLINSNCLDSPSVALVKLAVRLCKLGGTTGGRNMRGTDRLARWLPASRAQSRGGSHLVPLFSWSRPPHGIHEISRSAEYVHADAMCSPSSPARTWPNALS
jgi:hypothetical protein